MTDSYSAKFTTSASHHEEVKEEREELGSYFGERVRTVEATRLPDPKMTRPAQVARPQGIQPVPGDHYFDPALRRLVPNPPPLTDRQKRQKRGL